MIELGRPKLQTLECEPVEISRIFVPQGPRRHVRVRVGEVELLLDRVGATDKKKDRKWNDGSVRQKVVGKKLYFYYMSIIRIASIISIVLNSSRPWFERSWLVK